MGSNPSPSGAPALASKALYLRLLRYVVPYWRQFAVSVVGLVLVATTNPALAALFKPMLDGSFIERDPATILWVPLALVGLFVVRGLAGFAGNVALTWVAGRVVLDLRTGMFERLLTLPTSYYDQRSAGTVISKFTFDVNQVTHASTTVITVLIQDVLTVIGLLAWMFYVNAHLAVVSLIVAPVVTIIVRLVNRRIRRLSRSLQQTMGDMTHILEEAVNGHRVVKVFSGETYEKERFYQASNWVRRYRFKTRVAAAASVPLVQISTAVGLSIILYMASDLAGQGQLTVGEFVSFFGAMAMLSSPVKNLTKVMEPLQTGLAAAESVFSVLDESPEPDPGRAHLARARGHLEFRDVTFTYPGARTPALERVSLAVAPGETVALVGPSGSGKTTLANLLPRFYPLESGLVLLDGTPVAEFALQDLRRNLAYVGQDVQLFNDTVAANIAYGGNRQASPEAVRQAAAKAHALEFIEQLPQGFDTLIGDRGVLLSGGQRQRLGIARALLKDAPVLILDEATSALDTETERHVQAALETLRAGRSTLVIAHRLSTVENADRIVVLREGRVVETGTHGELLAAEGLYAELYRNQFAPGELS